jgi:hypothetical protein
MPEGAAVARVWALTKSPVCRADEGQGTLSAGDERCIKSIARFSLENESMLSVTGQRGRQERVLLCGFVWAGHHCLMNSCLKNCNAWQLPVIDSY